MGFGEAVRTCFSKSFVWDGRASRSEYWWFALLTSLETLLVDKPAHALSHSPHMVAHHPDLILIVDLIALALDLVLLFPALAVLIRRLHDTGRNGAWFWIVLIPFAGAIVLFIFTLLPSQPGDNDYGRDPLRPNIPRMTPSRLSALTREANPAGRRWCVNTDCKMHAISVDRDICIGCGEPTRTTEPA